MKPRSRFSRPWDPRRPIWLDGIPATIRFVNGFALVRTVGRAKSARFAFGHVYDRLDRDGRFDSTGDCAV